MLVSLDIINGLVFGIEHIAGDEEDDYKYMIVIHLVLFRIGFLKF